LKKEKDFEANGDYKGDYKDLAKGDCGTPCDD